MSPTIHLFMWGYQPFFRFAIERRAKEVLEKVAPGLEPAPQPNAILVGIRTPEKTGGHPVCVEPEDGEWDPAVFFECAGRAEAIYNTHPGHSTLYGDEAATRDQPENIRRDSVRQAVSEVLAEYDSGHGTVSFCGPASRVEGYHVVPVLQFDSLQIAECPHLPASIRFGEFKTSPGLTESTIESLLQEASRALTGKEPGRFFTTFSSDANGVLRDAGNSFCSSITIATGDIQLQGVFDALNAISSLRYEGRGAIDDLLFAPLSSDAITLSVRLKNPVPLVHHKLARKMIETTGWNLSCLCSGRVGISGLGVLRDQLADNVLRVRFTGHYKWDLYYKDVLVMHSAFGVPSLPIVNIKEAAFGLAVRRLFHTEIEAERSLWHVVEAAMKQRHGTIIVISAAAEEEAERLKRQSTRIEPVELTPNLVTRLSNIDGAILLDPTGVCHAIGVILDGLATEEGDASRGARYNSALRYVSGRAHPPTMCIVISDDGYVNMMPAFRPQVRRSVVSKYIRLLKTQNIDSYQKSMNWLNDHRFYLTADECSVINNQLARIEQVPMEPYEIRLPIPKFTPDPAMDDSYYLPEQA